MSTSPRDNLTAWVSRPKPLGPRTARIALVLGFLITASAVAEQRGTARPVRAAARNVRSAAKSAAQAADADRAAPEAAPAKRSRFQGRSFSVAKLLPTSWERWQSLEPGQRRKYIETLRRYTRAPDRQKKAAREIARLKKTSPETLNRMKVLLPKVQAFVASLTASEAHRLRAMKPEERARWIAQRFARERLKQSPLPAIR